MSKSYKAYTQEKQDGRRKISTLEHAKIQNLYKAQNKSMRYIARMYGVDRRLIQFIVYPERLKKLVQHNKDIQHHKKYYSRESHKLAMRKYRAKKRLLKIDLIETKKWTSQK